MNNLLMFFIAIPFLHIFYICLGSIVYRVLKFNESIHSPIVHYLSSLYLGVGLWFIIASFLGLLGFFKLSVVSVIIIMVVLLRFKALNQIMSDLYIFIKTEIKAIIPKEKFWKLLFYSGLVFSLYGILSSFSIIRDDGAAFYMPIAKAMAYSGWLDKLPGYDDFSAVGLVGEVQLATLLLYRAESSALMLSWSCFFPIIFLLYQFGQKLKLSAKAFALQMLMVFTSTGIYFILYSGKVDLFSAILGFSGIYFLFFEDDYKIAAFLLAVGTVAKLSLAIPLVPVVLIGFTCQLRRRHNCVISAEGISDLIKMIAWFSLIYSLVLAPHLVKNYVFFQNPFAPFVGTDFKWETTWYAPDTVKRIIMMYPVVWFYGDFWGQLGRLSLPILMFIPFAFRLSLFNFKKYEELDFLSLGVVSGLLCWLIFRPSFVAPRYIFAVLLMLVPLAAFGFDKFLDRNKNRPGKLKVVQVFLTLWCVYAFSFYIKGDMAPRHFVRNIWLFQDECARDGNHCYAAEELNLLAQPGERILQLTYFTYWLRGDLLQTMMGLHEYGGQGLAQLNAEELWTKIYQHDFKYILLDRETHQHAQELYKLNNLPSWVQLEEIFSRDKVSAFKIIYKRADQAKLFRTVSVENRWKVESIN